MNKQIFTVALLALLLVSVFSSAFLNVWQIQSAQATTFLSNGFEEGQLNPSPGVWTGNYSVSPTVVTTAPHHGTYHLSAECAAWAGSTYAYYTFSASATPCLRAYVRVVTAPSAGNSMFFLFLAGDYWAERVLLGGVKNDSGTLRWTMRYISSGTTYTQDVDTGSLSAGVDYCLEIDAVISGTVGTAKLYVADVETLSASSLDNNEYGNLDNACVGLHLPTTIATATKGYCDCVKVADAHVGAEVDPSFPTCTVSGTPYSTTLNWTPCVISALFADDVNISTVFVDTNVTDVWSGNITLIPTWISSTSCQGNYTMMLPKTVGQAVGFRWFANDTNNNWIDSGNYTLTVTANTIDYKETAVWIQDSGYGLGSAPDANRNIFATSAGISRVANDLGNNSIRYAIVFVGYFDAVDAANIHINYGRSDSTWTAVINALHARGIKAIAWAEDLNTPLINISAGTSRTLLFNAIIACMYKGFDGYNDDIEAWTSGLKQDQIDYLNNLTVVLHRMGKLNMPDVGFDWMQNTNMYLNVDYIISMFYSTNTKLEDPQAAAYWQEEFGLYGGDHGAPTSPIILGLMNNYYNVYPLPWQLAKAQYLMNAYTNRSLVGFCLYEWEYMAQNTSGPNRLDDWTQWNYWINLIGTAPPTMHQVTLASSPTGIGLSYQGDQHFTETIAYTFNVSTTIIAESSFTLETHNVLFGTADHRLDTGGWRSYTYTSGPYYLSSPTSVSSIYAYTIKAGYLKLAIYNGTSGGYPSVLFTQSSATACFADTWNLVAVSTGTLTVGYYYIGIKMSVDEMMGGYRNDSYYYQGRGPYLTADYSVAFPSTFGTPTGAISTDFAVYVPNAPFDLTPYTFLEWDDSSTNIVRTIVKIEANITVTATYSTSTFPSISLMYPMNTTYTTPTIPVNFTAIGGTIVTRWFNVWNGATWVLSNTTFTSYATITLSDGEFTFYAWAINTLGNIGQSTIMFTVTVTPEDIYTSVSLNTPVDLATSSSFTVSFIYTPTVRGDIFYHSELWLNLSGIYQIAAYNSSIIANYTTNIISYTFPSNNSYIWNIKIWNSTTGVFASSNRILTIAVYVAEITRYQITVIDKDLDLNVVDSYCTQQFLNGTTLFDYTEGDYTLIVGTVTIKTYYLNVLLNTTDFSMATYGNSTVTIYLNMKSLASGGYIAVNKSATITILNQTATLINATITASGTFTVVSRVTINATLVQLDGVNVTDWIFDAARSCIIANITSGDFSMTFVAMLGDPYFAVTVVFIGIGASISLWFYRRIAKLRKRKVP